ncbi:uncharacterized protein LOC122045070 [Zingiber officinale]|uniref:Uncharacterized protein n=1 Tax=Zingiber officinale TaxID=94328 RepID=A0A8J5HB86_ZINOF|nr:uncharacterized protein LOC122045070 [Zingiber officinale]KAG6523205.1 hypothetical protein ZIOFF_013058 [Zingiber officinale]
MTRGAWFKSLRCKSKALDDVVYPTPPPPSSSSSRKQLLSAASCADSSRAVKDAVFLFPKYHSSSSSLPKKPTRPRQKPKPSSYLSPSSSPAGGRAVEPATRRTVGFPTLSELPAGHSSRRVVELIFLTSWSSSDAAAAFPGEIEMLFRVHNPARTLARFEDRRTAARALSADARCAADGNEMMRFHYGPSGRCGGVYDATVSWSAQGKLKGVRTFSGSGGAHACGSGGAAVSGRSAMLLCRVIAGRVRGEADPPNSSESDSVSLGNDELVVLDPRAVLPCFLIIYKI